jgi:hypothetical protein
MIHLDPAWRRARGGGGVTTSSLATIQTMLPPHTRKKLNRFTNCNKLKVAKQ